MLRAITKPVGRYSRIGEQHDYPNSVWESIAKSAKMKLDDFSEAVEHNAKLGSPLKGRLHVRTKLGTGARQ